MNKLIWIVIGILILIIAYLYFFNKPEPQPPETQMVHDTTTITRYETQLQKDTVIKWYERIVTKIVKPDVIYQQKVDTAFIDRVQTYDLILGIEKKGTNLRVFALNQDAMLLKEQLFSNVYDDFSAYSADNKVTVKTSLWYWNGVKAGYEHKRPVNDLKIYTHSVDVMTGLSFTDRYSLDAGAEYDLTNKDIKLKGKFTVKLF